MGTHRGHPFQRIKRFRLGAVFGSIHDLTLFSAVRLSLLRKRSADDVSGQILKEFYGDLPLFVLYWTSLAVASWFGLIV